MILLNNKNRGNKNATTTTTTVSSSSGTAILHVVTLFVVFLVIMTTTTTTVVRADNVPIWTRAMNNLRSNSNLKETILNTGNVNKNKFGKLFSRKVEGHVYAQILYIPNLTMPQTGKSHNVMFVATMGNNLYAFDADDETRTEPLWKRNFGNPLPIQDATIGAPSEHCAVYTDIHVEVGIVSTPVIDQSTNTIYLVSVTKESQTPYVVRHRLHALDITTGQSRPNSPVIIEGQYPGTGDGSVNGIITFTSLTQNQRLSLTLADDGNIYLGFGSYCTMPIYHGWLFGYDKTSLKRTLVWCTTPSRKEGSIWQSGLGLIYEKPYLYAISANGYWAEGTDWGNSYLKIDPTKIDAQGLLISGLGGNAGVVDYFTPYNWEELWMLDLDLGTAGPLIIPGSNCLFGCSKQGYCYVVDKNNMGHHSDTKNNNIQYFKPNPNSGTDYPTLTMGTHGALTAWQGGGKTRVYVWPNTDVLKAFTFVHDGQGKGQIDLDNVEKAPVYDPNIPVGFPGGMLHLSANGNDPNTGILWAIHSTDGSANRLIRGGVLHAYDANDISKELWNSNQVPCRDALGNIVKFNHAVVTNGKVFVPSMPEEGHRFSTIHIYGLMSTEQANKKYVDDVCCKSRACSYGNACCGGACYSPEMYYCSSGTLCLKGLVCDPASPDPCASCPDSCCWGTCYDKTKQYCNGTMACDKGLVRCSDGCYDPAKYTCVNGYPVPNAYVPPTPEKSPAPYPSPIPVPSPAIDPPAYNSPGTNPPPHTSAAVSLPGMPSGNPQDSGKTQPRASSDEKHNTATASLINIYTVTALVGLVLAFGAFVTI